MEDSQQVIPLEHSPAWLQRSGERDSEYAWFKQYAETLGERDVAMTAARIGVAPRLLLGAAAKHQWVERCAEFDAARVSVASQIAPDDTEALAMQYAVGIAMMRLAADGLKSKNVALLKIDQIIKLMVQGSEMARRGAGVADLKIEKTVQQRIESEFRDLLGG